MFPKTDSPEFAPNFLWQIILLTVIVLALVLFSDKLLKPDQRPMVVETPRIVLYPWVIAGGHTIQNGLLAFSGKPAEAVNGKDKVRALAALIVVLVLLPTIFFLRWRRWKLAAEPSIHATSWSISRVFYSLCGTLVIYICVASLPIAVYGDVITNRLREAQEVQSNRDEIITELNFLGYDLFQYYILPKEAGGGDHRFDGYTPRDNASRTAEATYKVTPNGQTVGIHAESIRYSSSWVKVRVDSLGRLGSWIYGGKFL
jgi:hypothetical protein